MDLIGVCLTVALIAAVLYVVARIVGALTNWLIDEIEAWWDGLDRPRPNKWK